MIRLRKLV